MLFRSDTSEGIRIVRKELEETLTDKPSATTIATLLEKVLNNNNFTFGDNHYLQVKGTAMGTSR